MNKLQELNAFDHTKKFKIKTDRSSQITSPKNKEIDAQDDLVKKLTETQKMQQKEIDKLLLTIENKEDQIRKSQDLIKLQQKEIDRLTHINEYLMQANQTKLSILKDERQFNQGTKPNPKTKNLKTLLPIEKKNNKITEDGNTQSVKLFRRQTFRNPTLARFHPDDGETFKNDRNNSGASNFYDILQQEDCFRTNAILNIQLSDEDATTQYNRDGTVSLMKVLLESEENFCDIIQSISAQKLSFLYDKFKRIMSDHQQLFILVLRLKKIVTGALQMNSSVLLDDALQTIIDKCVDCLECDRASCFIVDQAKKELWTRVAKGTQTTIRLQIGQGLAGFVAQNRIILNIEDAYRDQRFNTQQDVKNNYKTKTLLVSPILDGDKCMGVLQCVNKQNGYFTKDDEALLQIMGEFSKSVLKNAMNHDAQMLIQNKLRHIIKTGIILQSKQNNLIDLILSAEDRLRSLMNVEQAKVVYYNQVLSHINREGKLCQTDTLLGIMGTCIQDQQLVAVSNCYTSPIFNPNIDIETNMPIICMPLKSQNHQIIGAIQVINVKGIGNISSNSEAKIHSIDLDMLELFCQQCAQSLQYSKESIL
ncbi:unnamed protein product (macronuclear) [Paramecium tetraurelia]|uniref:GAF domain-containing protein n=1 Tax=Paramecium tetraurelia TaxID=5888 RepID=A0CA80_PARTE|nr:uncharacterized protein GSPATT00036477001 [Paramecium tetraurelia]CAK67697.1 unnamed protein product [Paramecium tetraurelia]|eukprot:XP_001435094.1 hypothetical protein (macronuclear) [Paramecium tetraurelia strain d4-2]